MQYLYFLFFQLITFRDYPNKVRDAFKGRDNDLMTGFLLNLGVIILLLIIYYLILGNKTDRYNRNRNWYWLSLMGTVLCFVITMLVYHYGILDLKQVVFKSIKPVWYFSGVNALYCWVFFWPLSLIFNNFSKYYKFIPFNLIRKR